jgi:hypothetical protein
MEGLANNQQNAETLYQPEGYAPPMLDFEEELKKQNINTMIEIYGEEYMDKIKNLTR